MTNKAFEKLVRYISIRDHSIKELQDKLSKHFAPDNVNEAIDCADKAGLLPPAKELSEQVVNRLNSKGKGIRYINQYLNAKGLPKAEIEEDLELSKARQLVKKKFSKPESNIKVFRFLYSQGYDRNIARQVAHE